MSMNNFNFNEMFWSFMKYLLWGIYFFAFFGAFIFGSGWGIE